ncbi:hypothetical protein [Sphingobacterium sp. 40-24]|uniref:hypothetical protein n=1 Tax=Sphingobacterium sp. 40-24 TaxID=1895843 RepID=UPI000967DCE7|nr:hypothetical protein [Sphingobacterium sp. 40-24]OJZ01220.1 MAG: hypothetical protein BGP15_03200 [Sphingobacterium sp. 40-24]
MNFYIVSLLDSLAEQNLSVFCKLNFVKSAVLFSDLHVISKHFKVVTDFYFSFLKNLEFIPENAFTKDHFGYYSFAEDNGYDRSIKEVVRNLNQTRPAFNDVFPVQVRYTDKSNMHLVVGLCRAESVKRGFLHIVDLNLPKEEIKNTPQNVIYVKEIVKSYNPNNSQTLKEFIENQGYNYNHFQRDCKICFGDSFYSFWLKGKMLDAVGDIICTPMSLKEVAFKNRFLDYQNMYKAFTRHGVGLTTIPRLANL